MKPDEEKVVLSIVKALIRDIYGKYGLEQALRSIHPTVQVKLYEGWMKLVSNELLKAGLITEPYLPIDNDELSLGEAIKRVDYFLSAE